jgi:hypothetical protein
VYRQRSEASGEGNRNAERGDMVRTARQQAQRRTPVEALTASMGRLTGSQFWTSVFRPGSIFRNGYTGSASPSRPVLLWPRIQHGRPGGALVLAGDESRFVWSSPSRGDRRFSEGAARYARGGSNSFSVQVDGATPAFNVTFAAYFPDSLQIHPGDSIDFHSVFRGSPHTVTLGTLVDQGLAAYDQAVAEGPPGNPAPPGG